jgi:DNA polymerase III epsilon subunit-like protein
MNFVFLDTETGGLDPKAHALTSLGGVAFRIEGGKIAPLEGKFPSLDLAIAPEPQLAVCGKALEVQGLTWKDLDSGDRLSENVQMFAFLDWLECMPKPFVVVAHNAPFDRGFIEAAAIRAFGKIPEPISGLEWRCTRDKATCLNASGKMPKPQGDGGKIKPGFSLDALCLHFGISLECRKDGHGALADAKLGARVLEKLLALEGGK